MTSLEKRSSIDRRISSRSDFISALFANLVMRSDKAPTSPIGTRVIRKALENESGAIACICDRNDPARHRFGDHQRETFEPGRHEKQRGTRVPGGEVIDGIVDLGAPETNLFDELPEAIFRAAADNRQRPALFLEPRSGDCADRVLEILERARDGRPR